MTAFLELSCKTAIPIISALELVLFFVMIKRWVKTKFVITLLTACITFGLFYDALIIGLGTVINPAAVPIVSRFRFIFSGVLIPLLFAICAQALDLKKPVSTVVYVFTGLLMAAGLAQALATVLDVTEIAGITRMASVKGVTPAWAAGISSLLSSGSVIPLILVGIFVWIKQKNPFMFLAGFFMFAFSALGPATGNAKYIFYVSMYGELLMVIFLFLYAIKKEKKA